MKPTELAEFDISSETPNFELDKFSGPLDLLLALIKKRNISIFEINLVDLATQYLQIIDALSQKDNVDIASEYLVMASELLYLKVRLILADPEEKEQVEEDKKELLNLLAQYEQFKQISLSLREKEASRKLIYIKKAEDTGCYKKEVDESFLGESGNPIKLIIALRKMFEREYAEKLKKIKVDTFNLTPKERKEQIRELIDAGNEINFSLLFSVPSLNHFVITLIAVLDMVRKEELILEQHAQFETIYISKGARY